MALQKTRYIEGTQYPLNYHRIIEIRYRSKENARILLASYPDEQARRDGNLTAATQKVDVPLMKRAEEETTTEITDPDTGDVTQQTSTTITETMVEDDVLPGNVLEAAYRLIKNTSEWSDAKDI